jgi:hypothetical protein
VQLAAGPRTAAASSRESTRGRMDWASLLVI